MSVINNNLLLTAAAGATGYQVSRSLRFNSADSAYLSRTPASAGNRRTYTLSFWLKRNRTVSGEEIIFQAGSTSISSGSTRLCFANDQLDVRIDGNNSGRRLTTAVFRDFSAWYHILLAVDTTLATAADRIKVYVNGTQQTVFSTSTDTSQNFDTAVNSTERHVLGVGANSGGGFDSGFFSGYLAECHLIDGQQLTPSSFAETDATTGQWIPKLYSGSYGTNGFKLNFSDNSAATAAALGKDTSGNSNNWTPTNFSVTNSTKNYTSMVTCGGGFRPGYPASNIFDFSLATAAETQAVEGVGSGVGVFTPSPSIAYTSSVEVYGGEVGQDEARINGGSWVSVNGGWLTLATGSGTINTIEWRDRRGDGTGGSIAAIRVDGVQLVDASNAQNDSLVDTPTSYGTDTSLGGEVRGNYCTWNPLKKGAAITDLTNGNLDWLSTTVGSNYTSMVLGTIGVSSGKWYWENTIGSQPYVGVGIATDQVNLQTYPGGDAFSWTYFYNAAKYNNGASASYGASFTTGDVIGVALDLDSGTLTFYKNGVSQGSAYSGLSGPTYFPMSGDPNSSTNGSLTANFGQRPWAYTPPANYRPLVDTLLPTPVVAKPNTVMDIILYTGNGSSRSLTGLNFNPDFIWQKPRSEVASHRIVDSVRGVDLVLKTNLTNAEATEDGVVDSFDSNGFTGGGTNAVTSGQTAVAWCWDAGSSTVTNTQGSITSQVRANASAGFSIVTFTAPSSGNFTVGHGLNVTPQFMIIKGRDSNSSGYNWRVFHSSVCDTVRKMLALNTTDAIVVSGSDVWGSALPTSTVFGATAGNTVGGNGTAIAYCFSPVAGYSSFGSYTGNGSTDGPFVYCGFRPRWILVKKTTDSRDWVLYDSARDTYNVSDKVLYPNYSLAEGTTAAVDMLSNGFKIRTTSNNWNDSSGVYIYCAFAESSFQYARAR